MNETKPKTLGATGTFFDFLHTVMDRTLRRVSGRAADVLGPGAREGVHYFDGGLEDWPPRVAAEALDIPLDLFVKIAWGRTPLTDQELADLLSAGVFKHLEEPVHQHLTRLHAEAVREQRSAADQRIRAAAAQYYGDPPVHQVDADGNAYKPAVHRVRAPQEFVEAMIAFREWAGGPEELTSRKLAHWSNGVFSHSTINRILSPALSFENKPVVKLRYVAAFIEACGGTTGDVKEWNTAWRRAYKMLTPADDVQFETDEGDWSSPATLASVITRDDLGRLLRNQRLSAGNPPLVHIVRQLKDDPDGITLSRSALHDIFSGRLLPRWPMLRAVLRACGVEDEAKLHEWMVAWKGVRAAEDRGRAETV